MSKLMKVLPLVSILLTSPSLAEQSTNYQKPKTLVDLTGEIVLTFKDTKSSDKKGWYELGVFNKRFRLPFDGAYNSLDPMYIEMEVPHPFGFSFWPDEEKKHYDPYFGNNSLHLFELPKKGESLAAYMGCSEAQYEELVYSCKEKKDCHIYLGREEKKKDKDSKKVVSFIDKDHYNLVDQYCK